MTSSLSARLARLDVERFENEEDYALLALPLDWRATHWKRGERVELFGLAGPCKIEVELLNPSERS